MKISSILLIAKREVHDLLRDRRTMMIILGLPAFLYPVFALIGIAFAYSLKDQPLRVGIIGIEHLPQQKAHPESLLVGSVLNVVTELYLDDPPLIIRDESDPFLQIFNPRFVPTTKGYGVLNVIPLTDEGEESLNTRKIDVLLIVPEDFTNQIRQKKNPKVTIKSREGDETSKLAMQKVNSALSTWQEAYFKVGLRRQGVDPELPFTIFDPRSERPVEARTAEELRDVLVKFLPFLLVMWTLAGAMHPAIDVTAGEKERGTMETLLISPALRSEIVSGKFLAIALFSYGSALWNLLWMIAGALFLGFVLPFPVVSLSGLVSVALLAIPLALIFTSIGLGVGVFARSPKEGQHYLIPLFIVVMPLQLWSMTPGITLSPILAAVPITGLSMVMQNLMSVSGEPITPLTWFSLILSLLLTVVAGLWFASSQFRRESVLFRGENGPSIITRFKLWFRESEQAE